MIIHESRKSLYIFLLVVLTCSLPVSAQQLQPASPFELQNPGYGAAALGIGGAFVAVANDVSAIYWNPAGLAQLNGLHIFADYRYQGDSDEDISAEVFPNRFESKQRYEVSGNQFQAAGFSYAITSQRISVVPAFAWQRTSIRGPKRTLKETAGVVEFLTNNIFVQSEGEFEQEFDGGQEEFAFALSARAGNRLFIGGTWSFLRGGPEETVTGRFHDTLNEPRQRATVDLDLDQTRKEEFSGNYLKIGLLAYPAGGISIGGYIRFPYTRESDVTFTQTGPFQSNVKFLDEGGNTIREVNDTGTLQVSATARTEVEIPMELSAGIAMRPRPTFLVAGSITYSDYSDVELVVSDSSDVGVIPESSLLYPTLRAGAGPQPSLLQWRVGLEYLMGSYGNGVFLRTGYFRDGQPYSTVSGDREYFKGYSFGAGYITRGFRIDAAYVRETGDITFTPNSAEPSTFKNRRFVFSLSILS